MACVGYDKEKRAISSKAWRERNPERAKENRKRNYESNKERNLIYATEYNRKRRTGVTPEQYQEALIKQSGVCAICSQSDTKALAADHCHDTGKFRGLLCSKCNRGLGYLNDNVELLKQAIRYLNEEN